MSECEMERAKPDKPKTVNVYVLGSVSSESELVRLIRDAWKDKKS